MTSLILPTAYLGGCIAAMSIFSHVYRRAKNAKTIEPWFPENQEKEQYIALLNSEPETSEEQLKAALLRRAMEAMRRYSIINQEQAALVELMRTGHITDDIWHDFKASQDETVLEIKEVIEEGNTYAEGWGTSVFKTASQLVRSENQKEEFKKV
ncbi:Sec62/63 complex, subunit Sec66, partial [Circinella umbellata]